MTLTITLTPEEEERIRQEADARGLHAEECAHRLLAEGLRTLRTAPKPRLVEGTPAERAAAFRAWANSHTSSVVLPPEAFERESIYEDCH